MMVPSPPPAPQYRPHSRLRRYSSDTSQNVYLVVTVTALSTSVDVSATCRDAVAVKVLRIIS
jgi:hypothetical protein